MARPTLAYSACLGGSQVRFDGGHCRNSFLLDRLSQHADLLPLCPEVEVGLPSPRPALRLEDNGRGIELVPSKGGGEDLAPRMRELADRRVEALRAAGVHGMVVKRASPSCGLERVRVTRDGHRKKEGTGVFTARVLEHWPRLAVEEEGRLNDPLLRHQFLVRAFGAARLDELFDGRWRLGDLVAFHSREKYLLMAHRPTAYVALGRLVAGGKALDHAELEASYRHQFLDALSERAGRGRHVNVLEHMAGYFKDRAHDEARRNLLETVQRFAAGDCSLLEPLTLLRHMIRQYQLPYLQQQTYLEPYPAPLLRSSPPLAHR